MIAGGAGIVGFIYLHGTHQQSADVRHTITAFAEAADSADTAAMMNLMCAQEAAQFADGLDGTDTGGPNVDVKHAPIDIKGIDVHGDNASAQVTRPPTPMVTLKLKRENGAWRLCNPDQ